MPTRSTTAALALATLVACSLCACAAPTDGAEDAATQGEDALTSVKTGHYAIKREPSSGTYIKRLTIAPGKKVELELVRVRTTSEPWAWNPWIRIPTTKREALALRGTFMTFEGEPGETLISFDVTDRAIDHLTFALEKTEAGALRLKAIGASPFELEPATPDATPTDARVLTCTGRRWDAVITLDENQRRRGSMKVTRHADAERNDPPSASFEIAYTGDTGVADYMRFEGLDRDGNGYDFALRRSELERTSGPISQVGVGYTPEFSAGGWHNTLQCTIAAR